MKHQYTRFFLFLFVCFFITPLFAQPIWEGNTDMHWHTATNWDTGSVPAITDNVVIPNTLVKPVISTSIEVKRIEIQVDGQLTIETTGTLTINDVTDGRVTNHGQIINKGVLNSHNSITSNIFNSGTIDNQGGAVINIGSAFEGGIVTFGTFTNTGVINFLENSTYGQSILSNDGTFTNHGSIIYESGVETDIRWGLLNEEIFVNHGQITVNANANLDVDALKNEGNFTHEAGTITLNQAGDNGIFNNGGTFTNKSTLIISGATNAGISNDGVFHHTQGQITIDDVTTGILNEGTFNNNSTLDIGTTENISGNAIDNQATFTNTANITAGGTLSTINQGIHNHSDNENSAVFTNENGTITINNTNAEGIANFTNNTITNKSTIHIGNTTNIGDTGFGNYGGTFNNEGTLTIDRTDELGYNNAEFGMTTNQGTMDIGLNGGNLQYSGLSNRKATFINDGGNINIQNTGNETAGSPRARAGIINEDGDALFQNKSNGTININDSPTYGFYNAAGIDDIIPENNVFINEANLNIGNTGFIATSAIYNESIFTNETGFISIDRSIRGIQNLGDGVFTNKFVLNIGQSNADGIYGIENSGTFINENGSLTINRFATGITNLSGANFTNKSVLIMGNIVAFNNKGIENIGTFSNENGASIDGSLSIGASGNSAIENTGIFNNQAFILLGGAGTVFKGIENYHNTFNNQGGRIFINNAMAGGIVINSGIVTNDSCSDILLNDNFINAADGNFVNNGELVLQTTEAHVNNGSFINNGVLTDIEGNFPLENVTNNDLIFQPISGIVDQPISDAVAIGPENNFSIAAIWINSVNDNNAGTHTSANTFQPVLPAGTYYLNIELTDDVNNCTMFTNLKLTLSAPLPIELTHFTAIDKQNSVHLNWWTNQETNNKGFEIQKSKDGKKWDTIGFVEGQGNTSKKTKYSFDDTVLFSGTQYYRLKQIDVNGAINFSLTRSVFRTPIEHVQVFPNPVQESLWINTMENSPVAIQIFDCQGKPVHAVLPLETTQKKLDLSSLAEGMYYLHIFSEKRLVGVKKIVKIR